MKYLFFALTVFLSSTVFAQTGGVEGSVVDEHGKPIRGIHLASFKNGILCGRALTDIDGQFILKPLNPGTYQVAYQKNKNWYGSGEFKIAAGHVPEFTFVLSSDPEIQDSVKNYLGNSPVEKLFEFNIIINVSSKKISLDSYGAHLEKNNEKITLNGLRERKGTYFEKYISSKPIDPGPYELHLRQLIDNPSPPIVIRNVMLNTNKDTELNIVVDK